MSASESIADKDLVDRITFGDYTAFTSLYDTYIEPLTNYGLKFTSDINTVRDCLHDIFVSLWNRREQLQITTSFKSYLIKSLRSAIIQKINKSKKVSFINEDSEHEYEFHLSISPEEVFINSENSRQLYESIQNLLLRLTAKQKEVIYLRYYHNLSFDEIAGQLGLSVKACYKLMNRAMIELRQRMPNTSLLLFLLF